MSISKKQDLNSKEYWDYRFNSGNWEECGGREQTTLFAESIVRQLKISRDFVGSILDFGCGLGDAIPVYRRKYPAARLIGADFSEKAIDICQRRYGSVAEFVFLNYQEIPTVDIIISSNVLEHISNEDDCVNALLVKCKTLFIAVPYKEPYLHAEHLRSYDEYHFLNLKAKTLLFRSKGWGKYEPSSIVEEKIDRLLMKMGFFLFERSCQILYEIKGFC